MKKWSAAALALGACICAACGLSPNIDLPSFGKGESDSGTDTGNDDGGIGIGDGDNNPGAESPPVADGGAAGCSGLSRKGQGGYGGATATQANEDPCSGKE